MNNFKVPKELINLKQWVVWRYENRPGDPKPAKVPYNPNVKHTKKENWKPEKNEKGFTTPEYFGGAMSNNSDTWGTYESAIKAMESNIFNGLGIMFYDGLCGIDIDGCIENGSLTDPAIDIINIMDSYSEYSPSGTGLHILFFGKVNSDQKFYKKNSYLGIEIYDRARFFTFTGRRLNENKIEERTVQVAQVQLKYMLKKSKPATISNINKVLVSSSSLTDSEVIEKMFKEKNGVKYQKLWNGDYKEFYESQNEADISLCGRLSFYTGADFERIDSLFRQSGLYREKWEREDYRNNTLGKVIESTTETYNPNHYRSIDNKEVSQEADKRDKDKKFFLVPKNINNPEGELKVNISLLAVYMKEKYKIKCYKNQFRIFKNNYYAHVEDMKKIINSEIPERYRIPSNIRDVEDLLSMDQDLTMYDKELAPEKYISFANGVLNVETMQFKTHDNPDIKKLTFINQVGYSFDPNPSPCKYVDRFFNEVTNGKQEDINYLYQVLGVLISGYRGFKNIFYFKGEKDSGKSTYLNLAQLLITNPDGTKDYSNIGLKTLTDETSKEFTKIIDKRANISGESPRIKITNDTLLKQLSGGDTVAAHAKFKDPIEFVNRAMLIFSGNTVPTFFTSDKSAISERLLIYQFKNVIPMGRQIKYIERKMNMSYVLKKAVEQLKIFVDNNQEFILPQEIYDNREKMLTNSDTIYKFYKEKVSESNDTKDRVSNSDLYDAYIDFLVEEGHIRLSTHDGTPDFSTIKTTQYVFTSEIKKYHGEARYKRKLAYKGTKADCFVCMILK